MSSITEKAPLDSIITGHFNARSNNRLSPEINNSKGSITEILASTSGYN